MGMQTLFMYGAEELPQVPKSLLSEYTTFGGGMFGEETYDYIPPSYFAEMAAVGV